MCYRSCRGRLSSAGSRALPFVRTGHRALLFTSSRGRPSSSPACPALAELRATTSKNRHLRPTTCYAAQTDAFLAHELSRYCDSNAFAVSCSGAGSLLALYLETPAQ